MSTPTMRDTSELTARNNRADVQEILYLNQKVLSAMAHPLVSDLSLLPGHSLVLGAIRLNHSRPKLVSIESEAHEQRIADTDWVRLMDKVKKALHEEKSKRADRQSKAGPSSASNSSRASVLPVLPVLPVLFNDQAHGTSLYLNLDFSRHQIRLFELYPDQGAGDIRGAFHYGELSSCEAFTALSYTWGDETEFRHIDFDGGKTLRIRDNLWQFLHGQSLLITQPKTFWIDAICIDQANVRERNHQVNLMRGIYSRAEKVYVWLGKETDESDLAMDFLMNRVKRKLKVKGLGFKRPWSRNIGKALTQLCERSYWRRMWIIQEIICAQNITIWCGTKSCEWSAVESLYLKVKSLEDENWFTHHDYVVSVLQSSAAVMVWQRAHWRHPDTPTPRLETLIEIFRDWQCSDIRDNVYALVGMASKDTAVVPDYSRSALQLYRDVLHESSASFCGTLSQILGIPAKELQLNDSELIEYKRHSPDRLVLKARIQSQKDSDRFAF
ncbi:hypothetical protein ACHAP5_010807 [Fusarium lateritium]